MLSQNMLFILQPSIFSLAYLSEDGRKSGRKEKRKAKSLKGKWRKWLFFSFFIQFFMLCTHRQAASLPPPSTDYHKKSEFSCCHLTKECVLNRVVSEIIANFSWVRASTLMHWWRRRGSCCENLILFEEQRRERWIMSWEQSWGHTSRLWQILRYYEPKICDIINFLQNQYHLP